MIKKTGGAPKSTFNLPKLPVQPGLEEIHHFLNQALENFERQFELSWVSRDRKTEYTLMIIGNEHGGDPEWRLFSQHGKERGLLWNYVSCDVLLVHQLIVSSTKEEVKPHKANARAQQAPSLDHSQTVDRMWVNPGETLMSEHVIGVGAAEIDSRDRKSPSFPLNGDLQQIQIATLLQSIRLAAMTGKLVLRNKNVTADVFFVEGAILHADTSFGLQGNECILEVITWKAGKYDFQPRVKTEERTVTESLDALVLLGVQLLDKASHLRNMGLHPDSVLLHKYQQLTEYEFESRALRSAPVDRMLVQNFYLSINDSKTLRQLVEQNRLKRSEWIPLMCHLLSCDLIKMVGPIKEATQKKKPQLERKTIDKSAIHSVMMMLRRQDTALFTYPAFLYFLEQEYFRGYRASSPLSVILFDMRLERGAPDFSRVALPPQAFAEAVRRISNLKRHVDLLAHYENFDYAMILPNTKASGAQIFANRIVKSLQSSPLIKGIDSSNLSLAFGIASIPEDSMDLSHMLAGAELAKSRALNSRPPIVLFKGLDK